jgi:predicted chitinase
VTDRQYGIESAFYFWDARRLNAIADADNVREVTTAVNGGLNGLPDREARLQRVKQALGM